jgi:hypothetical protein
MAVVSVGIASTPLAGDRLVACVAEQGSAAHPYVASDELLRGPHAWRNLADAVHFLCSLHGRHPGVIDHAANRSIDPALRAWFRTATECFALERAFLAQLAVAAGPVPSTPGAGDNQAVVLAQRHAVEMLAQSERIGCALGAALALALDWKSIRPALETAAMRFGVRPPDYALGEEAELRALADRQPAPPIHRALLFGAEQIVHQHFGLWDLLEARQQARGEY